MSTDLLVVGGTLQVTVTDAVLNTNAGTAQSVVALVTASVGGASPGSLDLMLVETGVDTGVFTAHLETAATPTVGKLRVATPSGAQSNPITLTLAEPVAGLETQFRTVEAQRVGLVVAVGADGCDSGRFDVGAPLTITVTDMDRSHLGAASIDVTLTKTGTADIESVTLLPTGPTTGVYTGQIPTNTGSGSVGDGTLDSVATGDVVTVSYADNDGVNTRTGTATGGNAGVIELGNSEGGVLTVDTDQLVVTLTDPDLNTDSLAAETYLTHGVGGEGVIIYRIGIDDFAVSITETGADTGVFTGVINFRQPSNVDLPSCVGSITATCTISRLQATSPSDTVQVWNRALIEYQDPQLPSTSAGRVKGTSRVRAYLSPGSDGALAIGPAVFVAGSHLTLTVVDQDMSKHESLVETLSVTVSSNRVGEMSQTVTLTESGLQDDTFTGSLRTFNVPEVNTAEAGYMNVALGDILTATYSDFPLYEAGSAETRSVTVNVVGRSSCVGGPFNGQSCSGVTDLTTCASGVCRSATGELHAGPAGSGGASVLVGELLQLTVTDSDRNLNSTVIDSVSLTVSNAALLDEKTVTLLETGESTGVFTGSIQTLRAGVYGAGDPTDDILHLSPGQEISLQYDDVVPFITVSRLLMVQEATVGSISIDPIFVAPGDPVMIHVNDTDLNRNPLVHDTATAVVYALGDSEILTLNETGADTGIFTGHIPTSPGSGSTPGVLDNADPGVGITARYTDSEPVPGTVRSGDGSFGVVGLVSMSLVSYQGRIQLGLTDPDAITNDNGEASVGVSSAGEGGSDSIIVLLPPAVGAPGTFAGSFQVTDASPSVDTAANGSLAAVIPGTVITATYNDTSPEIQVSVSKVVTPSDSGQLFTSPATLPAGTVLSVTLIDSDLNEDPTRIDTAEVSVVSSNPLEGAETLTLTETAPATGLFVGSLQTRLQFGNSVENDAFMRVSGGDTIIVSYQDAAPYVLLANAVAVSSSNRGLLSVSPMDGSIGAGGVILVTVADSDLNTDHAALETTHVAVEVKEEGGRGAVLSLRILTLTETNTDSGVFTGSLQTAEVTSASDGSNNLLVRPRDGIEITYQDSAPISFATEILLVTASTVGTIDAGPSGTQVAYDVAAGVNVRRITAGDTVAVTVADADLDVEPQKIDTAQMYFISTRSADTVTVQLSETGANTGVFTGQLLTVGVDSLGGPVPEIGAQKEVLEVGAGDKIEAVYLDAAPSARITGGLVVRVASPGRLELTPAAARPGTVFSVTLYDADLDVSGVVKEGFQVIASTSRSGEGTEVISLVETSPTSGVFTGEVRTNDRVSVGLGETGIINLLLGERLIVSYTDASPSGSATASSLITNSPCGCATVSAAPTSISAGSDLSIAVVDPDRNEQLLLVETVSVRISNINRPAQVYVELVLSETGPATGVFTGVLQTRDDVFQEVFFIGPRTAINLSPGENLRVSYTNVLPTGPIDRTVDVAVMIVGTVAPVPPIVAPGQNAQIVVGDEDQDVSPNRDTVEVKVTSSRGSSEPSKMLTLLETGPHTGVFTASLYTVHSPLNAPLDQFKTVNVEGGDRLSLIYLDTLPDVQEIVNYITVAVAGTIDVIPKPLRTDSLSRVTVIDRDANTQVDAADSVSVTVDAPGRGSITLSLSETGFDTSTFTGELRISTDGPGGIPPHANTFYDIVFLDVLTFTYMDSNPSVPVIQTVSVLDAAPGHVQLPHSFLAGGFLPITVVDMDMNAPTPSSVTVSVSVPGQADIELELSKPTPLSTRFEGLLQTRLASAAFSASSMLVAPGDVITVTYVDTSPISTHQNTTTAAASSQGSISASSDRLATGGSITVTVTDSDLDLDADVRDTFSITAVGPRATVEATTVSLEETGFDTGVFTGTVSSAQWGDCVLEPWGCSNLPIAGGSDTAIYVDSGQTLELRYQDEAPRRVNSQEVRICSKGQVEVHPLVAAIGWTVTLEVRDVDQAGAGTANVTVVCFVGGDTEVVELLEVAPGHFKGVLNTSGNESDATSFSGTLHIPSKSPISIAYTDACPATTVSAFLLSNKLGSITLGSELAKVGALLSITVDDFQLALDEQARDRIEIFCRGTAGDEQPVNLTETGDNTGRFTGEITPGYNGGVTAEVGNLVLCFHQSLSPPMVLTAGALMQPSIRGILELSPSSCKVGSVVSVTVTDADLDLDPFAVETWDNFVRLVTPTGSAVVSLTETGPGTAVFTGSVLTRRNGTQTSHLELPVLSGQTIQAEYYDLAPHDTVPASLLVVPSNVGAFTISPNPVGISGRPRILVSDPDLDTDPTRIETTVVTVDVQSPGSGGQGICATTGACFPATATVVLIEMGISAQFFTGVLNTRGVPDAESMVGLPNATVNVMAGYTITLEYQDAAPLALVTSSAQVVASNQGSISLSLNPMVSGAALVITVIDTDLNSDPIVKVQADVAYAAGPVDCVKNAGDPDCLLKGTIKVTQTAIGSDVFTGVVYPYVDDDPCVLSCIGIETAEGAFITFTYADNAPAGDLSATTKMVSTGLLSMELLGEEGSVVVRVDDLDLDVDHSVADTATVDVSILGQSDANSKRVLTLTETGESTGVFTGSLQTRRAQASTFTAPELALILPAVTVGKTVQVFYNDTNPGRSVVASQPVITSVLGVLTITADLEQVGDVVLRGSTAHIRLADNDINLDPLRVDTGIVVATVFNRSDQGVENLVMIETGANTGVFTASIRLTYGNISAASGDGAVDISYGDKIHFVYEDAYPTVTVTKVLEIASVGELYVNPVPITAGQPITVTVVDEDLNMTPNVDTGSVTLVSDDGDTEVVTVTETSGDSGIFTGSINTQMSSLPQALGKLTGLAEGSSVQGTYTDLIPDSTVHVCPLCIRIVQVASTANVSIAPTLLDVNGALTVEVIDRDANLDAASVDIFVMNVTQTYRPPISTKPVTMTETGPDTSVFTGSLQTAEDPIDPTVLFAPQGSRIFAQYFDEFPTPSTLREAESRIASIGSISFSPNPLNPDGILYITVDDADLDVTDDPDIILLANAFSPTDVFNPTGHTIAMEENGPKTGVFTGQIQTNQAPGTAAGVEIDNAVSRTEITVTYNDQAPAGARIGVVRVASIGVLTVNPPSFESGKNIEITVNDWDLNVDRTQIEQVVITVNQSTADVVVDTEFVTCTETGEDTGYFVGILQTTSEADSDGVLAAPPGSDVSIFYTDTHPTPSITTTITRRVAIGGSLGVTWPVPSGAAETCIIVPSGEQCTTVLFSSIFVSVQDSDVPTGTTPLVLAYNLMGVEYETIPMTLSTGVTYNGQLAISYSTSEGVSDSGTLNLAPGDDLQISYSDAAPAREVFEVKRIATIGRLTFVGDYLIVGSAQAPLTVRLEDSAVSGTVRVTTTLGLDSEVITLSPTATAGIFTGQIPTQQGILGGAVVGDGVVTVRTDETVRILYADGDPEANRGMEWSGSSGFLRNRGILQVASVINADEPIYITVGDRDLSPTPTTQAQAYVTLTSAGGDKLKLLLVENGTNTGWFKGTAFTTTRDTGEASILGFATPGTDVTVSYLDCSDNFKVTAKVRIASIPSITFTEGAVTQSAGHPIEFTLVNTNLDTLREEIETAVVNISTATDYEMVTVTETGLSTGQFTGALQTVFAVGAADDGLLNGARRGVDVSASFQDPTSGVWAYASMNFTSESGIASMTSASVPFVAGEPIIVTVVDQDLNNDPYLVEQHAGLLRVCLLRGEIDCEDVTLVESERDSDTFTGLLPTNTTYFNTSNDGTLYTPASPAGGTVAVANYTDPLLLVPPGSHPLNCGAFGLLFKCSTAMIKARSDATLTSSFENALSIGSPITITVSDGDADLDFNVPDTVDIPIAVQGPGGASFILTGVETGNSTGVFEVVLLTASSGVSVSPRVVVNQGDQVAMQYAEAEPVNTILKILSSQYLGDLSDTENVLLPGGTLLITLSDPDLNTNPVLAETYPNILVTSLVSGQRESVILTETGSNTGKFVGILETRDDPARADDFSGAMHVAHGVFMSVEYNDVAPAVKVTRNVRIATVGQLTRNPIAAYVGGPLSFTVTDADVNRNPAVAESLVGGFMVAIRGQLTEQALTLFETGVDTGVFTAAVTLTSGANDPANSLLGPVFQGTYLTATYMDEFPLDTAVLQLPVFQKGSVEINPSPAIDLATEPIMVTVTDNDLNLDPDTIDVLDKGALVTVINGIPPGVIDYEEMVMTETGADTGIFTGILNVSDDSDDSPGVDWNSGMLSPVANIHTITATYRDMAPAVTVSATTQPGDVGVLSIVPQLLGAGVSLQVTVVDDDLNIDAFAPDTTTALVVSDRTREGTETVTLTETGNNTNTFVGLLPTKRTGAFSAENDGIMYLQSGTCPIDCSTCAAGGCEGYLTITYADVTPFASRILYSAVGTVGTITGCDPAKPSTDYCTFDSGNVFVTVVHPNLNTNPAQVQQYASKVKASAEFFSHTTGQLITTVEINVPITETGVNSDTWTGLVSTQTTATAGQLQIFDTTLLTRASTVVTLRLNDDTSGFPISKIRLKTSGTIQVTNLAGGSTLPVGQDLRITVVDGDMDYTRDVPDTVQVIITSRSDTSPSGIVDSRTVTLTETGASTSVFTGQMGTVMGNPLCDQNVLGVYSEEGTLIKAQYAELAPIGTLTSAPPLTPSWPGVFDITQNVTFVTGTIEVTLQDRDLIGAAAPQISFTVTDSTSNPTDILLTETSSGAETFTGTLELTTVLFPTEPLGTERVIITAQYSDASHSIVRLATVYLASKGVLEIEEFSDTIDFVRVVLYDSSADVTDSPDAVTSVTLTTDAPIDSEPITLTETGGSTGTFTGVMAVHKSTGPTQDNGIIETVVGRTITATYVDALPAVTVTESRTVTCPSAVTVPATFQPGTDISVRVSDCDLDGAGSVSVAVSKDSYSSDVSTLALTQEVGGGGTGIGAAWTGTITTSTDAAPCGGKFVCDVVSSAASGTLVTITYVDGGDDKNASSTADIGGVWTVTQTYNGVTQTNSAYKIGELVVLQIADRDANIDGGVFDTVQLTASTAGGDSESIILREDGNSTGSFTGLLRTHETATQVVGDGRISPVISGTLITLTYHDQSPVQDVALQITGTDFKSIAVDSPVDPLAGSFVYVTVVDSDMNADPSTQETVPGKLVVAMGSNGFSDTETVSLVETGADSSTFTARLGVMTDAGTRATGDSLLYNGCMGTSTCTVSATYTDPEWANFVASASSNRVGTISVTSTAGATGGASNFVIGEPIEVTVSDADLNDDASVVETLSVSVVGGSATTTLDLTETGVNTGVFTATISTRSSTYPYGATGGVGPLQGGDSVTFTYTDAAPVGVTATATITANPRASVSSQPLPATHSNTLGGTFNFTVTDSAYASEADAVNVSIYCTGAGITATGPVILELNATSPGSGVYTGSVATTTTLDSTDEMPYNGLVDWAFRGVYGQAGVTPGNEPAVYRRRATDSTLTMEPAPVIRAGALMTITVVDQDMDDNWSEPDSLDVVVSSDKLHEMPERVPLTETGLSTGTFTGVLPTTLARRAGGENDGTLNVVVGNNITVTYTDIYSSVGEEQELTTFTVVEQGGQQGTVTIVSPSMSFQESVLVVENGVVNVLVNDTDSVAPGEGYVVVSCGSDPASGLTRPLINFTALGGSLYFHSFVVSAGEAVGNATVGGCFSGQQVVVTYHDMLPFTTVTTHGAIYQAAELTAGPNPIGMSESLHVTVVDSDLNSNPLAIDVGSVRVTSSRSGEGRETVSITETGVSTGVFTGVTRTVLSGLIGAANSGGLNVAEGDTLTIEYDERAIGSSIRDPIRKQVATVLVGKSARIESTQVILPGTPISITVVDEDLPLSAGYSTFAIVTTDKDGESEWVNLTQIAPGSSTYTGSLETCTRCTDATGCADLCLTPPCPCIVGPCTMNCPSELQGITNDAVLYTEKGDLLTVTYTDVMPLGSYTAITHVARAGTLEVVPAELLVGGEPIQIILLSSDLNNDPERRESALVSVQTTKVGLSGKSVQMLEDGPNSGRFTGSLETRLQAEFSSPTDPWISVEEGDRLDIVYNDFNEALGETTATVPIFVAHAGRIVACSIECSSPSTGGYGRANPGDVITIAVTDEDLTSPSLTINVTVHLSPNPFADFEVLTLTYLSPGVFRGSLTTTLDPSSPADGLLSVAAGSVVTFFYSDLVPRTERIAQVKIAQIGIVAASPALVNGHPVLSISLSDQDLNTSPTEREAALVSLTSSRYAADGAASGISVSLFETGPDTGLFVGSSNLLKSATVRAGGNDGVFRGLAGDMLEVAYVDAIPAGVRNVSLPLSFVGLVDIPMPALAGNELFVLTVTDADLDTDPNTVDVATGVVTLVSSLPDSVTVSVTQTAPDASTFTAHIMAGIIGAGNDPQLFTPGGAYRVDVMRGGTLTATYTDSMAGTYSVSSDVYMRGALTLMAGGSGDVGGGYISISLTDFDLDGVPTVPVILTSARGGTASVTLTATAGSSVTFAGTIPIAAHPHPAPIGGLSLADSEQVIATYVDALPSSDVEKAIQAPNPRFVAPSPEDGAVFETAADCDLQIPLAASDLIQEANRLQGSSVYIAAVSYSVGGGPHLPGLIAGAALESPPPDVRYSTTLSWRPSRSQEGLVVEMCFAVVEGHALVVANSATHARRCITVTVVKCRKCVAPGESLDSIAKLLNTQWRVIWSANPGMLNPLSIKEGDELQTALKYSVRTGDSLASLAMRFGTSVNVILSVNPTLNANSILAPNSTVCVVPSVEVYDMCPPQPKSSTWEAIEEQYIEPDYFDNPYNWEYITYTDPRGVPVKTPNPDYPQLPAQVVGKQPGYSL